MKVFKEVFRLELSGMLCKWTLVTILAFAIILGVLLQDGISRFNTSLENREIFQAAEKEKVGQYVLYTQYGAYGIRLMFMPSPLSILFNSSTVFKDLTSNFDSGERLNISSNLKGENLFALKAGEFMDFAGLIILVGILMALLYGFFGAHNKEFLQFLSGFANYRVIFRARLFSRLILINLVFLILSGLALPWLSIRGIPVPLGYFFIYMAVGALVLAIFVVIGFITGSVKIKITGMVILGIVYFTFNFLIPWVVLKLAYVNAYKITSNYKLELDKLKLMMAFEKRFFDEVGIWKSGEVASENVRKLIKNVLREEYTKFLEVERRMKEEMKEKSNLFEIIAMLFPTTFYLANNYELSSQGYLNFDDFYAYTIKLKFQFVDFYAEKKFFSKPGEHIESFIKGDENVFVGKSRLSGHFWPGILLHLVYLLGLYFIACHRFKKSLFPEPEKKNAFANLDIDLRSGKYIALEFSQADSHHQFINVLSGHGRHFNGKISIDGAAITPGTNNNIVIIPNPAVIPGNVSVGALVNFFKNTLSLSPGEVNTIETAAGAKTGKIRYSALEPQEKVNLLLTAAGLKKSRVYILYDFARGLPTNYKYIIKEWVIRMKEKGNIIIDLPELSHLYLKTDYHSIIHFNGETYEEQNLFKYDRPDPMTGQ